MSLTSYRAAPPRDPDYAHMMQQVSPDARCFIGILENCCPAYGRSQSWLDNFFRKREPAEACLYCDNGPPACQWGQNHKKSVQ